MKNIWSCQKKAVPLHPLSKRKRDITLGAVVQLVRIHACHAWGREFESRPHRKEATCGLFLFLQSDIWILESSVRKPNNQIAIDVGQWRFDCISAFCLYRCLDIPHEGADTHFFVAFVEFLYRFEQYWHFLVGHDGDNA